MIIYSNRSKMIMFAAGSFALAAAGLAMVAAQRSVIETIIGAIGTIFFIGTGIAAAMRAVRNAPALIIDDKGIVDQASTIGVGAIPWSDIEGVNTFKVQNQLMLQISVRDPDKYFNRASALQRAAMTANRKLMNTRQVIFIPQTTLTLPLADIVAHVHQRLNQSGANR